MNEKDVRVILAGMALQGMLSNPGIGPGMIAGGVDPEEIPGRLVLSAVRYADALVAALSKEASGG